MLETLRIFIGVGILQGLLLGGVLIYFPNTRKILSRLLGLILFLSSAIMISEMLDLYDIVPSTSFSILFDLLFGPLILWTVLLGIEKKSRFHKVDWLHLIPVTLGAIWLFTGFERDHNDLISASSRIPDSVAVFVLYKASVLFIYSMLVLQNYNGKYVGSKTASVKSLKEFIDKLLWSFLLMVVISYSTFWIEYFGVSPGIDSDHLSGIMMTCFIYYATYIILRQPNLFVKIHAGEIGKYSNSKLDDKLVIDYKKKLEELLERDKPYLNEKVSLNTLAIALDLSPNVLSQVINVGFERSFNDLLNEYRIKEVKKKLLDPSEDHKSILALAIESGFQSKASFNRIFKKKEGVTPLDFRNNYRSQPTF